MEDKVKVFITFRYNKAEDEWGCYASDFRPTDDDYYEVTIPVPSKEVKEQKGEIKGQIEVNQPKQNNDS